MYAENKKKIEGISFNLGMIDYDPEAVAEREQAHLSAAKEVAEAFKAKMSAEASLPEHFDEALSYAVGFIYRSGYPQFPNWVKKSLATDIEWRQLEASPENWIPANEADIALVEELAVLGSSIASDDEVPAFGPHLRGRLFEALDPYDGKYNKYGIYLAGSETNGSYIK